MASAKRKSSEAWNPPPHDAPVQERLDWLSDTLRATETDHPVTGVIVDGREESSAIVLLRDGARPIVFPGSAALLSGQRLQAIVGAVLHRTPPNLGRDKTTGLADVVWSLAGVRNIYDSVDGAVDWGRSYLYAATTADPIAADRAARWQVFESLKLDERAADAEDVPPRARVVPWEDGARLVVRPWFHRHVQIELGHESLSEQRIATLMGLAGWESLPTARSALTAHAPDRHAKAIQFRFYVVPEGWEPSLDEPENAP